MALKQFLNPSTKWIPQTGYSVTVTDNGGAEAMQDVLIRTSDLSTSVIASFARNTRWEDIFPEVPIQYRNLKLKTTDPTDRGDGITILRCSFSGYTLAAPGSSGEEVEQSTSTLTGQLTAEVFSSHPKWQAISNDEKIGLGNLLNGKWTLLTDEYDGYLYYEENDEAGSNTQSRFWPTSANAIMFAKIINEGESTYDRGGWVYSYNTESEQGFTASQLNALGKIVENVPGNPKKPSTGYVWQLAAPQQTQSGDNRFIKSLEFRLIPDNAKNQFLYGE
jgi:hypothetical protein